MPEVHPLTRLLQISISPIVLISGVGLLLLSLTNRLGRVIDRIRLIVNELEKSGDENFVYKKRQLPILNKRSKILRSSIISVLFSILFSSLMILLLFLTHFKEVNIEYIFIIFFFISIIGLILSVILLILDILLTLKALKFQITPYL